jgi:hypothetical protein
MEVRHYLTFEFTGNSKKFVYTVSEDIKTSVQDELLSRNWAIDGSVIEFQDSSGRMIAVNARFLRRCQALYDAGIFPPKGEDETEPDMMIVMEGMNEPLCYNDIDPEDAALVASVMAGVDSEESSFVSFTDEDGEPNLVAADKIMLLESLHYDVELEEEVPENN